MSILTAQLLSAQLDLILLVAAVIANAFLAYVVYRSDRESSTNRIFALLSLFTVLWLINNYAISHIQQLPQFSNLSLLLGRLGILWAAPMSSLFFLLAHTIPSSAIQLSRRNFQLVFGATIVMMLVNLSPYAFVGVESGGDALRLIPGPGIIPFSIISTLFSILAVYHLIKKYRSLKDVARKQIGLVLSGILTMLGLIIATVLIPILFFNSLFFLTFTPLYTIVFLGMTAYAITKYQLFNIKVLLAQSLTLVICLVLFAKLFGEESRNAQIIDSLVLVFMIIFGFFLVRSVKKEVQQRELIQKQEEELVVVNKQQEGLLHFISHEIKGYLTKNEAGFAAITEGDYGPVSDTLKGMAVSALTDTRRGVETVMDILDASNLKKGTVAYDKKNFDFSASVRDVVNSLKPMAQEKGISLEYSDNSSGASSVNGDENKLRRHVIRNLIDNSIRYTPSGSVSVRLSRNGSVLRMTVADTGVGITAEDMKRLFTEGGHGTDSIKVNVHSTGYGLYIAKGIVEAHGGKIWVESEGKNKGSRFVVELPTV